MGADHSHITNLRIAGNTISGNIASATTVSGIVLSLTNSNLGSYTDGDAGATITGNGVSNLSSLAGTAVGLQIVASANAAFVAGNDVPLVGANLPLLLDFDGDSATGDVNGIYGNMLLGFNGRGFDVATQAETTFLADITGNTVIGNNSANQREGAVFRFTDKPSAAGHDSYHLLLENNVFDTTRNGGVDLTMDNTASGDFVIRGNQITRVAGDPLNTPDGLSISLLGTNVAMQATNVLRKSFIENNNIGITNAGAPGSNSGNGVFITEQEQSEIQDLQIRENVIANSGSNAISFLREDEASLTIVNPEVGQNRAVTIADNQLSGNTFHGILLDVRNGSTDLLDFEIKGNLLNNNLQHGIHLIAQADARMLVDVIGNEIQFSGSAGIQLDTVFVATTDKRQIGGTWIDNTISNNFGSGIVILGRFGLYDEATGIQTPLYIGTEGHGNTFESNRLSGVRVSTAFSTDGQIGFTDNIVRGNNTERSNGQAGLYVSSVNMVIAIKNSQFVNNFGKGIDLESAFGVFSADDSRLPHHRPNH